MPNRSRSQSLPSLPSFETSHSNVEDFGSNSDRNERLTEEQTPNLNLPGGDQDLDGPPDGKTLDQQPDVDVEDDQQIEEDETEDQAHERLADRVVQMEVAVARYLDPAVNGPLELTRNQARNLRNGKQAMLNDIVVQRQNAVASVTSTRQRLEAAPEDRKPSIQETLDRQEQAVRNIDELQRTGIAPWQQSFDEAQQALDDAIAGQRTAFDQAVDGIGFLGAEIAQWGFDDLLVKIEALQREMVRKKAKDPRLGQGGLGNFAKSIGMDIDGPEGEYDGDYSHIGYTLNTSVPGREEFTSIDENRQIDHDPGHEDDPWTGERPENVARQIQAMMQLIDDAWTKHQVQLQEMRAEDPDLDARSILSVFVGPEWFFGFVRVYNSDQKAEVIDAVLGASAAYPEMLIIPGTILWSPDDKGILNTLPVAKGGTLLREQSKKHWGGDSGPDSQFIGVDHKNRKKWVRSEDESPFLDLGNLKIAIDICQDHDMAQAKQNMYTSARPGSGVDLHLVVSAGQSLNDFAMVSDIGGYGLSSDAARPEGETQVKQVVGEGSTHQTRNLQNVGDNLDNGKGQKSSNLPLPIDKGKEQLEPLQDRDEGEYDPATKDDYKELGSRNITPERTHAILEGMLDYAQDHIDNGKKAKKSRVQGMIKQIRKIMTRTRDEDWTLAQYVVGVLESLRVH
jgi:hypothetical protein